MRPLGGRSSAADATDDPSTKEFSGVQLSVQPIYRLPTTWSTAIADAVSVNHFEGEVTVPEMDQIQRIGDEWYRRYPDKSLSMSIVYPTTHRPPSDQRDRLRRLIKHWEQRHLAASNVMLIEGLLGSMHRSVLTGVMMIVPPPHPFKVFASVESAVPWLLSHQQGTRVDVASLQATIERLCVDFLARPERVATV